MPDRPSAGHRVARAAAILCSLGLFGFVVVNAQLGCDSPAQDRAPREPDAQPSPPLVEAEPKAEPEGQPASVEDPDSPATPPPSEEPQPSDSAANPEPVFMPASKSGGDFGSMRFPGEAQQQKPLPQTPQQANQAPNQQ